MSRPPRAFDVPRDPLPETPDRPAVNPSPAPERARRPRTLDVPPDFVPTPDVAAQRLAHTELALLQPPPPPPTARRFGFAKLVGAALGALASLALALALDELLRELFERAQWLGWVGVALLVLLLLGAAGIVIREIAGLRRLRRIERLRNDAVAANAARDPTGARGLQKGLLGLYADRPDLAAARERMAATRDDVLDGPDVVRLAERNLLRPLDARARNLVLGAAKRVSVVTAVSPRALIDVGYVLYENARLVRQLADLYGGRPGTLGFWQLARKVAAHLAVTGSIAVGDSLLQQAVGHGVAARLSTRLGEGVLNGALTARIGIAAMDQCRPMPFLHERRPGIGDLVADLTRGDHNGAVRDADTGSEGPR